MSIFIFLFHLTAEHVTTSLFQDTGKLFQLVCVNISYLKTMQLCGSSITSIFKLWKPNQNLHSSFPCKSELLFHPIPELALNLTQIPKKVQTSNQINNNVFENEFASWSRQKHTHWLKVNRQFRGKLFLLHFLHHLLVFILFPLLYD